MRRITRKACALCATPTAGTMQGFISRCRVATDLMRPQQLNSPTAKYLQHSRHGGVAQAVEQEVERLTLSSSSSVRLGAMPTDGIIDTILASRSLSAFHEHCEELILRERKKLYAIHRPTTARPTPSDYIRIFAKARMFLRNVTHASLQHPVVMQLLDIFMDLWRKPIDPHVCSVVATTGNSPHVHLGVLSQWLSEGDGPLRAVVGAALTALPPHDCLLVIGMHLLGDDAVAVYRRSTASMRRTPSSPVAPEPQDADATMDEGPLQPSSVDLILWCMSLHSDDAVANLSKKHGASKGVLAAIKSVQSPEVIAAAVSALILIGTRESRQHGIDICEAYLTLRMHAPQLTIAEDDKSLTALITSASEAAAVMGDSELVTRFIFMLFRAKGALAEGGAPEVTAARSASPSSGTFASTIRSWLPLRRDYDHSAKSGTTPSFDDAVAQLLRNAIKSATIECGISQAQNLFEALRSGCTWKAIALMGLELLEALEQRNMSAPDQASPAQDAYAILGRLAAVYPRQPSLQDESWLHAAVMRTMRLHFSFSQSTTAGTSARIAWAVPRNPRRALELYARLPIASSLRKDARLLAVAAAAALPAVDGMRTLQALLREELGSDSHPDEVEAMCSAFVARGGQRACAMAATLLHGILMMPHASTCMPKEWAAFVKHDETFVHLCGVVSRRGVNVVRADELLSWLEHRIAQMASSNEQDATVATAIASALLSQSWVSEQLDVKTLKQRAQRCLADAVLHATGVSHSVATVLPMDSNDALCTEKLPSSLMLLHPSVALLPPQRFSTFLLNLATLRGPAGGGGVALIVPWETIVDNSVSANRLRSLINSPLPRGDSVSWMLAAMPSPHNAPADGQEATGEDRRHEDTLIARYAVAIKGATAATHLGSALVVWSEEPLDAARCGGVRVVSTSTNDRRKALNDIQQLLHAGGDVASSQAHALNKGGSLGRVGPVAAAGVPQRRAALPSATAGEMRPFGGLRDTRK